MQREGFLYIIIDRELVSKSRLDLFKITKETLEANPDFIQFRFKDTPLRTALQESLSISKMAKNYKSTSFIVNDRVDIAKAVDADGVHLGNRDLPVSCARKILGKKILIGKTVHCLKDYKDARDKPLNYISIGPVFKTALKPGLKPLGIKKTKEIISKSLPGKSNLIAFVVGGITLENVPLLIKEGLTNIALSSNAILSKNLRGTIKKFRNLISFCRQNGKQKLISN